MESGKSCEKCNLFAGYADSETVNCRCFESYKGYAVIERRYMRPASSDEVPCPFWTAIPKDSKVGPYQKPPYDNAMIFQKRQYRRRRK